MSDGGQAAVRQGAANAGDGAAALRMAVGDAKSVRRGAVAGQFGVNRGPAPLACSSSSRTSMPAPSPRTKPSRRRSKGRDALRRVLVEGRQRGQQVEAGHAEGMDHAVGAAGQHEVGVAVADQFGRFADGLAAGGTGGQAVIVGPCEVEMGGQVAGGRVQLLLGLPAGVEIAAAPAGQTRPCPRRACPARNCGRSARSGYGSPGCPRRSPDKRRSGCGPPGIVQQAGIGQSLLGGGGRKLAVGPRVGPAAGIRDVPGQVEVLDLGGKLGGKAAGVEERDRARRRSGPRAATWNSSATLCPRGVMAPMPVMTTRLFIIGQSSLVVDRATFSKLGPS